MNNIYFIMALHFHQPVGNFPHIIERAYKLCYLPFLETLSSYPDIKMAMHFSGCLIDYLEESHPESINLIQALVARGQVEMIGGAYYEAILPAIPERDSIGQIAMMKKYLRARFNRDFRGAWVAERVWEEGLERAIRRAGAEYIFLDDSHFLRSGLSRQDLHGYFAAGKKGRSIAVFPSDKELRYAIPFKTPAEIIGYFSSAAQNQEGALFVYGDDGEKFGEWPGTYKWVYDGKWLKSFFEALIANSGWLKLVHPGEYIKQRPGARSISIKPGSYDEMMEWIGPSWMGFVDKYPESAGMRQKMLYVSDKIARIEKTGRISPSVKAKLNSAKKHLYQGQCNCAYWHGVFGGLYLFHLRDAVYRHLAEADAIADSIIHARKKKWFYVKDFVMADKNFWLRFDADNGGVLKELDLRASSFNLINTLSRRPETYHKKIKQVSEAGCSAGIATIHDDFRKAGPALKEKLVYDRFSRDWLRSYFLRDGLLPQDILGGKLEDLGDFASGSYCLQKAKDAFIMEREGRVLGARIRLSKRVKIVSTAQVEIDYIISAGREGISGTVFGAEFNFAMPYLNSGRYNYFADSQRLNGLDKSGRVTGVLCFGVDDAEGGPGFEFCFSQAPESVSYFPVETVSQSEKAYELNYQGSCVFPVWKPDFSGSSTWKLKITFLVKQ